MRTFLFILPAILLIGLIGCRSTKTIQTAMSKKDTISNLPSGASDSVAFMEDALEKLNKKYIEYNSFSGKLKINFTGRDGKNNDFNAYVRMYHDSAIWISVNAVLGIEALRVLVTPDSIKVLNKIDKVFQLRTMDYLKEITRLPFDFYDLQELIIGNPVFLTDSLVSYRLENSSKTIAIISTGENFNNILRVDKDTYQLQNIRLDDKDQVRARSANLSYSEYIDAGGRIFPSKRKIILTDNSVLLIEMEYKQVDFNEELSMPFSIPKNYKGN